MSNQNAPWAPSSALAWYYELVHKQTRLDTDCLLAQKLADYNRADTKLQGMMCTLLHIRDGVRPVLNEYLPNLRILNLIQTNKKGEDELTPAGLSALAEWETSNESR